jgi:hypothetical protein
MVAEKVALAGGQAAGPQVIGGQQVGVGRVLGIDVAEGADPSPSRRDIPRRAMATKLARW